MTNITIALPEEPMARLKQIAAERGIAPEELLTRSIEQWLTHPDEDFARAAAYILQKNAELYRRFATPG